MPKICIFCGSSMPRDGAIAGEVLLMANTLAEAGWDLVYGGGNLGLMGVVARAFLSHGHRVIGIMPIDLMQTAVHNGQSPAGVETLDVADMFERKDMMMRLSDAFLILPGGVGTLDELTEVWTHRYFQTFCPQFPHAHAKPISMALMCKGDQMTYELIHQRMEEGFISKANFDLLHVGTPQASLNYMASVLVALPAETVHDEMMRIVG